MLPNNIESNNLDITTIGLQQIAAFFSYLIVILIAISLLVLLVQAAYNNLQPAVVNLFFNSTKED